MGAIGECCCCTCLPEEEVPITTVPGTEETTENWLPDSGGRCCWTKYFDYTSTPDPFVNYISIEHLRFDGSVDYKFISNFYGIVITGTTEHKYEVWDRFKVVATPLPDLVTGHDVKITWSKVCGTTCGYGAFTDYWVMEYTQRFRIVVTQQRKEWGVYRLVNAAPNPSVPRICAFAYDDGKWYGGTAGGAYVTNSSSVPAQEDIWTVYSISLPIDIEIRRFKLFTALPTEPTSISIPESDDISECQKTPCMVDEPIDGYEFLYTIDPTQGIWCTNTWSLVANAALTPCPGLGISIGPANRIKNQVGDVAEGYQILVHLTNQPCGPHPLGGSHCWYKEYSNLSAVFSCDRDGDGVFVAAPLVTVVIEPVP